MKKHLNNRWTLLLSFTLFAWLAVACAPGMQSTEVSTPAPEIVGRWTAHVEMPDGSATLDLVLNISQSASGALTAALDIPVMGVYNTPVTFSYEDGIVKWGIPDYGADFTGSVIDSSTIEGTVTNPEGGPPGTMTFKRVE